MLRRASSAKTWQSFTAASTRSARIRCIRTRSSARSGPILG
jgi:hypothetical protein